MLRLRTHDSGPMVGFETTAAARTFLASLPERVVARPKCLNMQDEALGGIAPVADA